MNKQQQHGFTVIELMVTLVLASILITLAVPSFNSLIRNNRVATQSNDLLTSMIVARSESSKRGLSVSVCSHAGGTGCGSTSCCAASTNWATGWIVFVDFDRNGAFDDDNDTDLCEVDAGKVPTEDCLLRINPALTGNPTLTASANFIRFNSSGEANAVSSFVLTPQGCTGDQQHTLGVNLVGRAHITTAACP